jgi:hypothetical protein
MLSLLGLYNRQIAVEHVMHVEGAATGVDIFVRLLLYALSHVQEQ